MSTPILGEGMAKSELRTRFWVETVLAAVTGGLFVLTLFWRDWLEVFGIDPDNHDGSVEWLIVAGLFLLSVAFAASARREWSRAAPAH